MAAYNKFQDFVEQLVLAKHDFSAAGNVFKIFLTNEAPLAADTVKADMVEITAQNGYPAGGTDIQNSVSEAAGTVTIAVVDVSWTASGGTFGPFQYIVTYNDTQTAPLDALVNWWDRGAALTVQNGETFTVDFAANTLFTLS